MKILFLCTGNSCRSQMAEGWSRHLLDSQWQFASAGLSAKGLDPRAIVAMAEVGVDIASQRSEDLGSVAEFEPDWVVTVCGHADEHCPVLPGATRKLHAPFDDPPRLALEMRGEQEVLDVYRRVRDEIGEFVSGLPRRLKELSESGGEESA